MSDFELAREALRLRERGQTYAQIGEALGISRGKAHHLVRAGLQRRAENAWELARAPGRTAEPSSERGQDLLARIRRDFRAAERVIGDHVDPAGEEAEQAALFCEWINGEFTDGISALLDSKPPSRSGSPGQRKEKADVAEFATAERRFSQLLEIADQKSEVLREQVGAGQVLSVFSRDLAELAEIAGLPFTPRPPIEPPTAPGGAPGETESAPAPARRLRPLDAKGRHHRNERIVTARLAGGPVKEVAEAHGLSGRQLRRIMEAHREGHYAGAPAALEATMERLRQLARDLQKLEDLTAAEDDPNKRLALIKERLKLQKQGTDLMRSAGLLSPEAWGSAQKNRRADERADPEWVQEVNGRLRRLLADRGADPELIEAAVDEVVIAAGWEDLLR